MIGFREHVEDEGAGIGQCLELGAGLQADGAGELRLPSGLGHEANSDALRIPLGIGANGPPGRRRRLSPVLGELGGIAGALSEAVRHLRVAEGACRSEF